MLVSVSVLVCALVSVVIAEVTPVVDGTVDEIGGVCGVVLRASHSTLAP